MIVNTTKFGIFYYCIMLCSLVRVLLGFRYLPIVRTKGEHQSERFPRRINKILPRKSASGQRLIIIHESHSCSRFRNQEKDSLPEQSVEVEFLRCHVCEFQCHNAGEGDERLRAIYNVPFIYYDVRCRARRKLLQKCTPKHKNLTPLPDVCQGAVRMYPRYLSCHYGRGVDDVSNCLRRTPSERATIIVGTTGSSYPLHACRI